jgi:hypothetical protein
MAAIAPTTGCGALSPTAAAGPQAPSLRRDIMTRERQMSRELKKPPLLNLKEKRAIKKTKKETKSPLVVSRV